MSNKSLQLQIGNLRETIQVVLLEINQLRETIRANTGGPNELAHVKEQYVQGELPELPALNGRHTIGKALVVSGTAEKIINNAKSGPVHSPTKPSRGKRGISRETQEVLDALLSMTRVGDERAWEIVVEPFDAFKLRKETEYVRGKIHYLCVHGLVPWAMSKSKSCYATFVDTLNPITNERGDTIGHRLVVRRIEPTPRGAGRRWIDSQLRGVTQPDEQPR